MKRKLVVLLLSIALISLLGGCGSSANEEALKKLQADYEELKKEN